ncbi:hypothetical protein [Bradyrhizobium niftali]|nr:hypothetical protein [Bradyrhizobium niftali]
MAAVVRDAASAVGLLAERLKPDLSKQLQLLALAQRDWKGAQSSSQ